MTRLSWDDVGARKYETGVDQGVLYTPNGSGEYDNGFAWNGLTNVNETPSGAESNPQYADNMKYLDLKSAEEFGATIEALTYPDEFAQFDGMAEAATGVYLGQQGRRSFGLSYRTRIGNDVEGDDYGYKLHLVYGCSATPSEKSFASVNDSPEATAFSWEVTTVPVIVPGYKPTSILTIESPKVAPADLLELENLLYGTPGQDPRLPHPTEVIAIFAGAQTAVMATNPTFVAATGVITIPTVTGVRYYRDDTDATVSGTVTIGTPGATLIIKAEPSSTSYLLSPQSDDSWSFTRS